MILTGKTIREIGIINPHVERRVYCGMSYGEGLAGYDIRIRESVVVYPGRTTLGVSLEHFNMPRNVLGRVCDKSTWIRCGVYVGNTVIEPGWRGYLTLELTFSPVTAALRKLIASGSPIAQVIFERIEEDTAGYSGKYQDQPYVPVGARFET